MGTSVPFFLMQKYQVIVEVDESQLTQAANPDVEANLCDLIQEEMGWVTESGIYVVEVKEYEEQS